jgi:excinuclease ABC subunit C
MVVFENGMPNKNEYRKYKITNDKNDDYGTMKEVTYRRYYRMLVDDLKRPNLIIADGGIGQMHAIKETLDSLNLDIMVVGLKKNKRHATEALLAGNPIREIKIDKKSNLFYLLERMQDEVHNYTINYHKNIRSKGSLESILDVIPGIGEKRKQILLKKYKTIHKMKTLTKEDLKDTLPDNVIDNLLTFLKNNSEK